MGAQTLYPGIPRPRLLPLAAYLECCVFQLLGLAGCQFWWQESNPTAQRDEVKLQWAHIKASSVPAADPGLESDDSRLQC